MLTTEEVEDDFFTPVAGTSLANIFDNVPKYKEGNENESLKYLPPKPQNTSKKKEEIKATECVFACALIAHEWFNNVYNARGKLGLAIMKIQKTGDHNIILYDSNKMTLSSTGISASLKLTVNNNSYISFYDTLQKYWSVYGTEEEIKKICEVLESLEVNINYSSHKHKGLPQPNKFETEEQILIESMQSKESDTDSSVNRKTKASILNRMASMGHSVLPTRTQVAVDSSESSDTTQNEIQSKNTRHKPFKASKKNSIETIISEPQHLTETYHKATPDNNLSVYNRQLLPIENTSVFTHNNNELGMFMSEQRISNSELRININRISDKVDSVLNKINNLEHKDKNVDISTDILLKLLAEYENKIKVYEELLKSKDDDGQQKIEHKPILTHKDKEIGILNNKLTEIHIDNQNKSGKIAELENELKVLEHKYTCEIQNITRKESELLSKINYLEGDISSKSKEIADLTDIMLAESKSNSANVHNKVKNIMNDTFQNISMNFKDNESYSGETIKRIVGAVIKKNTVVTLNDS